MRKRGYPVYMHNSVKGIYYQLRAWVYFTSERKNDVSALLIGNATRVNLWHGVGLKKILHDVKRPVSQAPKGMKKRILRKLRQYPYRREYVLSTSETMSKIFSGAFKKPREKILQLGQPRNDVFFNDEFELESLPFLKQGQKMILYMPTHRLGGKSLFSLKDIFDLEALNRFCQNNGVVFVFKKHFYHRMEKEDLSRFSNLIDITSAEYDTQLLLKKTAILITDYSSCYVDYLLLNKPVIFYNYDYENYVLNDRDLYFDYETTTPGPKVKDFASLLKCLEKETAGRDCGFESQREKVKNIFYSPDNQRSVGEKILQYVKENIR
jgi:CDP-glycerol glycerophosphotransferase (TagB/SpsB family)